jgi:rhamnosyltransferase
MPQVSVVIPTLNAGPMFAETLAALRRQQGCGAVDLLVVDSESSDGTVELARSMGARVRRVLRVTFNHGVTRNLGAALARGDLIAFLTQDALPANEVWLQRLCEAMNDPEVAGVYSRIVPRPGCSPLVQRSVQNDLVFSRKRLVKRTDRETLAAMDPFQRRVFVHFNNVASMVRRSSFERIPFPEVPFGEDLAWGERVLAAGKALVFEPTSEVIHSHESELREDFLRHRCDARLMRMLFGFRNRDGWRDCWPALWQEVRKDYDFLWRFEPRFARRLRYLAFSPLLRAAQIAGQWAGSYAALGPGPRFATALPGVECKQWVDMQEGANTFPSSTG